MIKNDQSARLSLPQVTLCAASSVNVAATLRALEISLTQIDVFACKLFTDAPVVSDHHNITVVPIEPLTSTAAYSAFMLSQMVDHIDTSHCLVIQWDGHVINVKQWRPEFLEYDYIGARWPQFTDGYDVGNGGFSLRSRRLMEMCRELGFRYAHPEDVAIGRDNRTWLEGRRMRFATPALSDLFSAERAGDISASFGYHGVWHMPKAIGTDKFWSIYQTLDDRSTINHNFKKLFHEISKYKGGKIRAGRIFFEFILSKLKKYLHILFN